MSDQATQTAPATPASGAGLDVKAAKDRLTAVGAAWAREVDAAVADTAEGDGFTPEVLERTERYQREYDTLQAAIQRAEKAKERDNLTKAQEDLTSAAPRMRDLQADLDAKTHRAFMEVGQNRYRAESKHPHCDTTSELYLGQPAIVRNTATGRNEVMPFPAQFGADNDTMSLERTYRMAEIVQADKFGLFTADGSRVDGHNSPVGKQRRVHAILADDADLSSGGGPAAGWDLTTIGGMLVQYMIQMNDFLQWCKVIQTDSINNMIIDRRTEVAAAGRVQQSGTIPSADSTFNNVELNVFKYGVIRQYTFETTMFAEPWSVAQTVAQDGGIALTNGIGQDLVTGGGTTPTPDEIEGIVTYIKANTATTAFTGVDNTNFLRGTNAFGHSQMAQFVGSLQKEYFRMPSKKMMMPLSIWSKLMGLVDGDERPLFVNAGPNQDSNINNFSLPQYAVDVVLDENLDPGTATSQVPIVYGDLMGYCARLARGVRVDFSTEYGYANDRLAYRFLQHAGGVVVDINAFKGYQVA